MTTIDPNAPAHADGIYGLPPDPNARVVLVPVPYEATVSYGGGSAAGPEAIRRASVQVELYDLETGHPYREGIRLLPADPRIAQLNLTARAQAERVIEATEAEAEIEAARDFVNRAGAEVNEIVRAEVSARLAEGRLVGTIGGDHSTALGAIRAHAEHFGSIGVLHLDAHADLRHAYHGFTWSHASIMDCVLREVRGVERLIQVGIRDFCPEELAVVEGSGGRVRAWFDPHLARARARGRLLESFDAIAAALPERVYVSFDIDGLDPRLCPHTGTPVPGGLDLNEVSMLLESVVESGRRIVGFDLMEVAPGVEGDDWDGNVGARALYKLIGWALRSQAPST